MELLGHWSCFGVTQFYVVQTKLGLHQLHGERRTGSGGKDFLSLAEFELPWKSFWAQRIQYTLKTKEPHHLLTELCQIETDQTPGSDYMVGVKELQQGKT